MHIPFTLWMNFFLVQLICIANLYDGCKCIFYTILFLYICVFYDMLHILLSCDSLRDPWNVYCIVFIYLCIYLFISSFIYEVGWVTIVCRGFCWRAFVLV
jgi:hypothetical protein